MPGPTELIIVLVIVMVIFGASRLPQIGKGLGEGIKNFKQGVRDNPEINVTPKQDATPSSQNGEEPREG
jgi:sec-independent protein translocase protein TatA